MLQKEQESLSAKLVLDRYPVKNHKITAHRIIDGQAVVVNLKENAFNALNEVATRIWELADGRTQVKEIIDKVYQEFEIDWEELKSDCLEFLNQMINKGLLTLSSYPGGD